MDRDSVGWKGYWIAAPTPFTEMGALNESALRNVLRLYHDQGVHGHCHINIGRAAWNQSDDVALIMRSGGRSSPAARY
jgi:hypothetical protein